MFDLILISSHLHIEAINKIQQYLSSIEVFTDVVFSKVSRIDSKLLSYDILKSSLSAQDNYAIDNNALRAITNKYHIDFFIKESTKNYQHYKFAAFDMDSTLIQMEVIDELAVYAGVEKQVSLITEKAMRGELDFNESLYQRVSKLAGLTADSIDDIIKKLPITQGVVTLFEKFNDYGYKTAIFSGGFSPFGRYLQEILKVDYVYCNQLDIVGNQLTGLVKGDIINAEKKAYLLKTIAEQESFLPSQCIAVGDGANDLLMLNNADFGVAFHAKPIVRQQVQHQINFFGLDTLIIALGFPLTD